MKSKSLGGGGGASTRRLGKPPEERTTKHLQLLVRDEVSVVEIVAFAMRTLSMPQGLKWSCQYLNRLERRWIVLLRNHNVGSLVSDEFQGLGPDGIHVRLVAPGYKGIKAALRAQRKSEEISSRFQTPAEIQMNSVQSHASNVDDTTSVTGNDGTAEHRVGMIAVPSSRTVLVGTRQSAMARL